jgi:hypothetical protein
MFRRYFSRVLFGFAAFVFVVLWAYAHNTYPSATVSTPVVDCVANGVNVTTAHWWSFLSAGHSHTYNYTYANGVIGVVQMSL